MASSAGSRDFQVTYQQTVAPGRHSGDNPRVVSGSPNAPRISLQEGRKVDRERSDPAAADAYDRLVALGKATRAGVHLVSGDLIIVKNNRALHGRSSYKVMPMPPQHYCTVRCLHTLLAHSNLAQPRYNDDDRWVQRYTSFTPRQLASASEWFSAKPFSAAAAATAAAKL